MQVGDSTTPEQNKGSDASGTVVTPDVRPTQRRTSTSLPTDDVPLVDTAIEYIQGFEFDLDSDNTSSDIDSDDKGDSETGPPKDDDKVPAPLKKSLIMFAAPMAATLPALQPEPWPYGGEKPNPITIGKARKLLADAYARINCTATEAGEHGYAWMVETKEKWTKRSGVKEMTVPQKPSVTSDPDKYVQYLIDHDSYRTYHHLLQEGKRYLVEWFGKAMFSDLHVDGSLPVTTY